MWILLSRLTKAIKLASTSQNDIGIDKTELSTDCGEAVENLLATKHHQMPETASKARNVKSYNRCGQSQTFSKTFFVV